MNYRILLSVLLLSVSTGAFGIKDSEKCCDKFKSCAKETVLCPGRTCMTTSIDDITEKSLSDLPCLYQFFDVRGKCFNENGWNYLPVTVLLAAGAVYGLTRKPVVNKVSGLIRCIKKKLKFGSKKHNEAIIYRKVAQWKEEIA